jgi:predicted DNA-binding transcriptional regulator
MQNNLIFKALTLSDNLNNSFDNNNLYLRTINFAEDDIELIIFIFRLFIKENFNLFEIQINLMKSELSIFNHLDILK